MHWLNHIRGHIIPPEECVEQAHSLGLDRAYHNAGGGAGAGFGGKRKWTPMRDTTYLHTWLTTDAPGNVPDTDAPAASWNTLDNRGTIASPGPDYANTTKSKQPLQTALNGRSGCLFVTASQTYLVAAAGFRTPNRIFHSGTGCTLFIAIKFITAAQAQQIFRTGGASGARFILSTTVNAALVVSVVNSGGTTIYSYTGPNSQLGTSNVHLITYRYDVSRDTDVDIRLDGNSVSSGNLTGLPSDVDSGADAYIGSLSGTSAFLAANLPEFVVFNRWYSDAEVGLAESYLRSRWGY